MGRRFQIFLQITIVSLLIILVWAPPGMAQAVPAADSCLEMIAPVPIAPREKATLAGTQVTFEWTAGFNVAKYHLQINSDDGGTELNYWPGSVTEVTWPLSSGHTYWWYVEGLNSQGDCSTGNSPIRHFTVNHQVIPPGDISWVSASKGTVLNRVKINWGNTPRADYFQVYRSELNGTGINLVGPASGNETFDDYGDLGKHYKYLVEACNAGGCGPRKSDEGWTGSCLSESPVVTLASPKNGEKIIFEGGNWPYIHLSWSEVPGVTLYEVEGVTDDGSSVFEDGPSHFYPYSQGEVEWRVRALDPTERCGPGPWSERWSFTLEDKLSPTPINLKATRGAYPDKVVLTWEMPESEESFSGFYVFRHMVGEGEPVNITPWPTIDTDVRTYTDTSVVPGKVYVYWVSAEKGMLSRSPLSQSDIGYAGTETPPALPGVFLPMIGR